jgi:hypothetical protein
MQKGLFLLAAMFSVHGLASEGIDAPAVPECTVADVYYSFNSIDGTGSSALTSIDLTDSVVRRGERPLAGSSTTAKSIGVVPIRFTSMDVLQADTDGGFVLNVKHITLSEEDATVIAAELARQGINEYAAGRVAAENAPTYKLVESTVPFKLVSGKKYEVKTDLGVSAVEISCF